jgi:hypothetical protein
MDKNSRRYKIFTSPVWIFVCTGTFFGVFTELTSASSFHWKNALFKGVVFGAFSTVLYMRKMEKLAADPNRSLNEEINWAIRTNKLPKNASTLKALPEELNKREQYTVKNKKQVNLVLGIIITFTALLGIAGKDLGILFMAVLLLGAAYFNHYSTNKILRNIHSLRGKLK